MEEQRSRKKVIGRKIDFEKFLPQDLPHSSWQVGRGGGGETPTTTGIMVAAVEDTTTLPLRSPGHGTIIYKKRRPSISHFNEAAKLF